MKEDEEVGSRQEDGRSGGGRKGSERAVSGTQKGRRGWWGVGRRMTEGVYGGWGGGPKEGGRGPVRGEGEEGGCGKGTRGEGEAGDEVGEWERAGEGRGGGHRAGEG